MAAEVVTEAATAADMEVGMQVVWEGTAEMARAVGAGLSREADTVVNGTGFARVRGQARSHRDRARL